MPRPSPEDSDFWDYASGDTLFATWLKQVDDLCQRFLDTDVMALRPATMSMGMDLAKNYDCGINPEEYLAEIIEHLKVENGANMIYEHVARVIKWGNHL